MKTKHSGTCPFCKNTVRATVIEENVIRRDKCSCPECQETIYICRSPGCENYAKGGDVYDDELCPACTNGVTGSGSTLLMVGLGAAITALVGSALEKKE